MNVEMLYAQGFLQKKRNFLRSSYFKDFCSYKYFVKMHEQCVAYVRS